MDLFSRFRGSLLGLAVGDTLEAALWAFRKSESFEEGCLLAVNLGDDSDTVGAVYGQLAGAYYGVEGVPGEVGDEAVQEGNYRIYG
jgi:ADP-ribosyl-[dinitrogen reductase] hydrolase